MKYTYTYTNYIYTLRNLQNPGQNHKGNVENQVLNSKYTK